MENFKQKAIGKSCLGAEMFRNHPQRLGEIYVNPDTGHYEPKPNATRPWKKYVTNYLNGGDDRCHSFSYWGMTKVCCDYLNNPCRDDQLILVLIDVLGSWLSKKIVLSWNRALQTAVAKYEANLNDVWKRVKDNLDMDNLNKLLEVLNSSVLNLRFPANNSLHWNRSVSNCYDVRDWCYVDANLHVISDQDSLGTLDEDIDNYSPLVSFPVKPQQEGFYLKSMLDHFLLYGLCVVGYHLQDPHGYLFFSMGQDNGVPYLASSSNNFPKPVVEGEFPGTIYIYNWDDNTWNVICG